MLMSAGGHRQGVAVESHVQKSVTIDENGWCLIDGVLSTQNGFPGDAAGSSSSSDAAIGYDMTSTNALMVDMVVLRRG